MGLEGEAEYSLLKPDIEAPDGRLSTQSGRTRAWGHWIAHALLVSILVVLASTRKLSCSTNGSFPSLHESLPQEALGFYPVRFNGSIDLRSEWKGMPRPQLEASWNSVTYDVTNFPISRDDLEKNSRGEYKETTVRFPPDAGDGYMAGLEVFHHLHCLNMLRKVSYHEHYQDHDILWTDPPDVFRNHIDHCIDMLRQRLMCSADVGLVTHVWVKGYGKPYPDYSTVHQCRDFGGIRDWVLKRQLPTNIRTLPKPLGVARLDKPPFP